MWKCLATVTLDFTNGLWKVLPPVQISCMLLNYLLCCHSRARRAEHHYSNIINNICKLCLFPIRRCQQTRPGGTLVIYVAVKVPLCAVQCLLIFLIGFELVGRKVCWDLESHLCPFPEIVSWQGGRAVRIKLLHVQATETPRCILKNLEEGVALC
jgi:hypothetical protein